MTLTPIIGRCNIPNRAEAEERALLREPLDFLSSSLDCAAKFLVEAFADLERVIAAPEHCGQ